MISSFENCHSVFDLKNLAKRKLPGPLFEFIEGGAEDEWTLQRNRESFTQYRFNPRVLKDVSNIDICTQLQGIPIDTPVIIAPTGMPRLFNHEGERAVCRAAEAAGTIYSLSTVSTCSIEEVAAESQGPKFFQVYAWKNRAMIGDFIERCKQQNYKALLLAADLAVFGNRKKDLRNGHGNPAKLRINTALSALTKPVWLYHFITSPQLTMANMPGSFPEAARPEYPCKMRI